LNPPRHSNVLVIGAGSAGCVVAERLSVDPDCTVTVVEAGPGPAVPGVTELTGNGLQLPVGDGSPVVARFETVLTEHPVRSMNLVRGATVGGSGAVNGGYFCRAVPADFDEWDLDGWRWSEVLDHFRAVETDLDFAHSAAHGDSGLIPVLRSHEFIGPTARFVETARDAGFAWLADLNDGANPGLPTGIGAVPLNIVHGVRVGPGSAFLAAASARRNLSVLSDTRVWQLRIVGGRAMGVDLTGPAGSGYLSADRIVLSAGAIGSAQLLMVSGVGEERTLRAAGIPVVVPAPVGMRCADHPEWVLPTAWGIAPSRPVLEVVMSLADGIEIRPYTGGFAAMVGAGRAGQPDRPHIGVALMKPRARALITVVSADPGVPPRIEHRYDSEPADVAALSRGVEVARELAGATRLGEPLWSTSQHLCGSAPMGRDGDSDAVVDSRCRLRGVEGLWVIDGSVLPSIPSRGPHATTVMLGHRAAEFVREG
jgi:predicted dehydrogenase (TIGR03970 family)